MISSYLLTLERYEGSASEYTCKGGRERRQQKEEIKN